VARLIGWIRPACAGKYKKYPGARLEAVCHYTILGVGTEASADQLKMAYTVLLNRFRDGMKSGSPLPREHFDAICEAYKVLSDPAQRARYDRSRTMKAPDSASKTGEHKALSSPAARSVSARKLGDDDEATVEFRGQGGEYFRIWLVNTALTVLTLGIYSAWAKVRREKYFHRNLIVDGAAFDYHGKPKSIFLGRLLVILLFSILSITDKFGPAAKLAGLAVIGLAFPWLMVQSMRFRARNTSYRGVRLGFSGSYSQAFMLYLLHGGLALITLGLYAPVFIQKQKAFFARNLSFGDRQCDFYGTVGDFYRGLSIPMILGALVQIAFIATMFAVFVPIVMKKGAGSLPMALVMLQIVIVLMFVFYAVLVPWIRVVGMNLFWNHLRFGGTSFVSTLKVRSYIGLIVANWLLTVLTLGFFWPFAQIRLARFRARQLFVIDPAELREAVAASAENPAALGSEALDVMDLDVSF
jgi:uncharacterized membrane protein YjgN (DUF898 family)